MSVKINAQRLGAKKRALLWGDIKGILLAWGSDGVVGNSQNGLVFQFEPPTGPPEAYTVWCDANATAKQRNKFLGAYKKLREELEQLARDNKAHVNEWNHVTYGGYEGGLTLHKMFPGGHEETATPEEPVRVPPKKIRPTNGKKRS